LGRRKIEPQLKAVHTRGAVGQLAVDDSRARRHPLHLARPKHTTVAPAVGVLQLPVQYKGDRLEPSVRMGLEAARAVEPVLGAEEKRVMSLPLAWHEENGLGVHLPIRRKVEDVLDRAHTAFHACPKRSARRCARQAPVGSRPPVVQKCSNVPNQPYGRARCFWSLAPRAYGAGRPYFAAFTFGCAQRKSSTASGHAGSEKFGMWPTPSSFQCSTPMPAGQPA